jgi:hypothetical protein
MRDDQGFVKIGYRGTRYTHPVAGTNDGRESAARR